MGSLISLIAGTKLGIWKGLDAFGKRNRRYDNIEHSILRNKCSDVEDSLALWPQTSDTMIKWLI